MSPAPASDLVARAAALPVPFSILSSIRFYRSRRDRPLPGTWFVELFGELGVAAGTVRQTLYRLERQHVLTTRKKGRIKFYTPTPSSDAAVDVGSGKIFREDPAPPWDGQWTVVHLHIGSDRQYERNRMLDILRVEGFAPLAGDAFIHPREPSRHILTAARDLGVDDGIAVFRGRRTDRPSPRETAACWDLAVIRLAYDRFLATFDVLRRQRARLEPRMAFAGRLVLVHEFLSAAWEDPDLPAELLPPDWPADTARRVARTLYERWKPAGLAFADAMLARVTRSVSAGRS